jgi:nifR3 family TIM-barrel protein
MGVQIFGATPKSMARAARLVCDRLQPDFLDLNFGCPAHKVIEQNAGSGLLRCTPLLYDLVKAVRDAIPETPLTAKMRLGWDAESIVAVEVAGRLETLGVEALAVHGRTRQQGYGGQADWDWIARVAAAVSIPVVGNGDIRGSAEALARLKASSVSGLMIGRAALASPWVFRQVRAALDGQPLPDEPGPAERWETLIRLAEITLSRAASGSGERDVRWMFAKLHPLTHGLPGCRKVRDALQRCHSLDDLRLLAGDHLASLGGLIT